MRWQSVSGPVQDRAVAPGEVVEGRLAADQHVERRIGEQPQRRLQPPPVAPARAPPGRHQPDLARDQPQPPAVERAAERRPSAAGRRTSSPRPPSPRARPPPSAVASPSPLALAWITRSQSSGAASGSGEAAAERRRQRRPARVHVDQRHLGPRQPRAEPGRRAPRPTPAPTTAIRSQATAPASQTMLSAVSMFAASTARPGGTPARQRHRHRRRRREAVLVRMQHEDVAARRAPPARRRPARPRHSRTSPETESSPACSGARIRARSARGTPPRKHQRLGAAADAAEPGLDHDLARPRRPPRPRSSATPGPAIQSARAITAPSRREAAAREAGIVAACHVRAHPARRFKAARGVPVRPHGPRRCVAPPQFAAAAAAQTVLASGHMILLGACRRPTPAGAGDSNREHGDAYLDDENADRGGASGDAPRDRRQRAQGIPPLQTEFANGATLRFYGQINKGILNYDDGIDDRDLLPHRQRQLEHPVRLRATTSRSATGRSRTSTSSTTRRTRPATSTSSTTRPRPRTTSGATTTSARSTSRSSTTATASSGSARAAWRPTASPRSTSPAPTSSAIPASATPPAAQIIRFSDPTLFFADNPQIGDAFAELRRRPPGPRPLRHPVLQRLQRRLRLRPGPAVRRRGRRATSTSTTSR